MSTATVQPLGGCTLAEYAAAKQLPIEFLRELRLSDLSLGGRPAVRIPYLDSAGVEIVTRYRTALARSADSDARFRWKVGSRPVPYGLWRLAHARATGFVVLVEGESDAQTLWFHGIPALGLPGANTWRETWAAFLDGIPSVSIVVEPDSGGLATTKWLSRSALRHRARLITLPGVKDPSALYLLAPNEFRKAWQAAMDSAAAWSDVRATEERVLEERAYSQCAELAANSDILTQFATALAEAGVTGESRSAKLLYLCLVSRFLKRPVSLAVKGPSAAGKSYLVERVLEFFPASAFYALSAMSEMALAYSEEPLQHRFLVLYEAVALRREFAAYLLRSLLSEARVRYETVEKTTAGLKARLIEREGPTGLIVTTTAIGLHAENETRMFSVQVSDSSQQTHEIMLRTAQEERSEVDLSIWHALQEWLACAEHGVTIPYSNRLADLIPPRAVRLRRDFRAILSLIWAHAILHQRSRARDQAGRIIATLDDYAAVRALTVDLVSEGVGTLVRPTLRETVAAVEALIERGTPEPTIQAVANQLQLDKSAASRRVRAAQEAGYLKNLEDRRGMPARLALGEPLPGDLELLPLPEQLALGDGCTVAVDSGEKGPSLSLGLAQDAAERTERRLHESWDPINQPSERSEGPRGDFGTPQGDPDGDGREGRR